MRSGFGTTVIDFSFNMKISGFAFELAFPVLFLLVVFSACQLLLAALFLGLFVGLFVKSYGWLLDDST